MSSNSVGDYKFSAQTVDNGFWFKCDGRTLLRSDYPDLYNIIGTSFGSTNDYTFKLPKAQGRVVGIAGTPDSEHYSAHAIGHSTGDEAVVLNIGQIPEHTHTYEKYITRNNTYPVATVGDQDQIGNSYSTLNTGQTGGTGSTTSNNTNGPVGTDPTNIMQPTLFIGNLFILWKTN
jgi:microcystin-dependent protein